MKGATPLRFLDVSLVCSIDLSWSFCHACEHSDPKTVEGRALTICRSKTPFRRVCCLPKKLIKNWFPFSSASVINLSNVARTPTISLKPNSAPNLKQKETHSHWVLLQSLVNPTLHLQWQETKNQLHSTPHQLDRR